MEYQHPCIKCSTVYKDTDPDPYYCPSCLEQKKAVAAQIDATLGSRPKKQVQPRFSPEDFIGTKGRKFFSAKDFA